MKTTAIAATTLREMLRRKVQVNLLVFGIVLVLGSYAVSLLTVGEMYRIVADLGLAAMEAIGTLLAVFLGATVIAGDVEARVVYQVVAKPVSRTQYVFGRYVGLAATLLLNLVVMSAALAAVLILSTGSAATIGSTFASAAALIGVQLLVVSAIAVLFSAITSSTLAAMFTFSIAVAGHLTRDLVTVWQGGSTLLPKLIWYTLPNLGALSINADVLYRRPVPTTAWSAAGYGLLYSATALALASAAFERRDLK